MITVRSYQPDDYDQLKALYLDETSYGGQFDEDRDSPVRLNALIAQSPHAILVAAQEKKILGTVSLIKDARTAWLFRFAVEKDVDESQIVQALYDRAAEILKSEGHQQVLVYGPAGEAVFQARYEALGFAQGGDYTCYWRQL